MRLTEADRQSVPQTWSGNTKRTCMLSISGNEAFVVFSTNETLKIAVCRFISGGPIRLATSVLGVRRSPAEQQTVSELCLATFLLTSMCNVRNTYSDSACIPAHSPEGFSQLFRRSVAVFHELTVAEYHVHHVLHI